MWSVEHGIGAWSGPLLISRVVETQFKSNQYETKLQAKNCIHHYYSLPKFFTSFEKPSKLVWLNSLREKDFFRRFDICVCPIHGVFGRKSHKIITYINPAKVSISMQTISFCFVFVFVSKFQLKFGVQKFQLEFVHKLTRKKH